MRCDRAARVAFAAHSLRSKGLAPKSAWRQRRVGARTARAVSGRPAVSARYVLTGPRWLAHAHANYGLPIGRLPRSTASFRARSGGVLHELPGGGERRRRRHASEFGVRGLNLWPRHSGARRCARGDVSRMSTKRTTRGDALPRRHRGRVGDRAVGSRMRRRKLRRHLQGDVDTGERLADWTSHLRRFGRRFESGGVEPVDVA